MYLANMLSRAYLTDQQHKDITPYQIFQIEHEETIHSEIEAINFTDYLKLSEVTQQQEKKHTESDTTLQTLLAIVHAGWPLRRKDVSPCIRTYWSYRDEITAQNGILYKGSSNFPKQAMTTK